MSDLGGGRWRRGGAGEVGPPPGLEVLPVVGPLRGRTPVAGIDAALTGVGGGAELEGTAAHRLGEPGDLGVLRHEVGHLGDQRRPTQERQRVGPLAGAVREVVEPPPVVVDTG